LLALATLGALLAGCERDVQPDLQVQVAQLSSELENARAKLESMRNEREEKRDEKVLAATGNETVGQQLAEKERVLREKDAQLQALQGEVAKLKRNEGVVFLEIRQMEQQGLTALALSRYQRFVTEYPNSPLVTDASRAIAELGAATQRESRARVSVMDPKRPEREVLKRFSEGFATAEEMAPLLKGKSMADVLKLLGPPNRRFRDGTELGYVDSVLDPAGGKGTLVISFEGNRVSSLRVGYQGREIKP
jgi:hypothetical protein